MGTESIVIQEGYALYMTQVIPCIDKMVAALDADGIVPSFITGHSLGGATATAYAQFLSAGSNVIGTSTFLVTFGAPPTAWGSATAYPKYILGVKTVTPTPTGPSAPLSEVTTGSVRFFHKFDPVPSSDLYMNKWEHTTAKALLLYDMPMTRCFSAGTPSCVSESGAYLTDSALDADWANMVDEQLSELHSFLCTGYDVKPSGYMFSGPAAKTYYSYMNMFNPMPCAEVLVSNIYESLVANGVAILGDEAPFVPKETFAECTESYLGTVKAYFKTYLASDLEGFRGGKNWETDYLEHTTFVLAWGLMYVHMTYPNYPLCATKGYGDYTYMGGKGFDKDPVETFTDKLQAHLPGWTPGTGSGDGKYGFGEYDWESKNQPTYQAMYGDLADFWETQTP